MKMRRVSMALSLSLVITAIIAVPVRAHDLFGLFQAEDLDARTKAILDQRRTERSALAIAAKLSGDEGLESVVRRSAIWPMNRPVTVCFFEGSQSVRKHIIDVANDWVNNAPGFKWDYGANDNIRTCDANAPSDIRIGFRGRGYASYVGTDAKLISKFKPTMILENFDTVQFSERDDGVIRHEWGHALGFEHEHQSPDSPCEDEFNWERLYASLPWPKDTVDFNMRRLNNSSNYNVSVYDPQSIMHYDLQESAFRNPDTAKCYIKRPNNFLSEQDKRAVVEAYPAPGQPRIAAGMAGTTNLSASQREAMTEFLKRAKRLEKTENGNP
jgi:hypothetical protein